MGTEGPGSKDQSGIMAGAEVTAIGAGVTVIGERAEEGSRVTAVAREEN